VTTREKKYNKRTAWNKFKSLEFIEADKFRKLETDKDVLEFYVFPVVLYGAQLQSFTEEATKRPQNRQRKIERRIQHVVWNLRGTNAELRLKTNTTDIVAAAQSLKGKWAGQMARMDQRFVAERKNRQKNRATEDPMDRHVQESCNKTAVTSSKQSERVE